MLTEIYYDHLENAEENLNYEQAEKAIKSVVRDKTRGEYDHILPCNVIKVMDKSKLGYINKKMFLDLFDILYVLRDVEKRMKYAREMRKSKPKWRENINSLYTYKYYEASLYLIIVFSLLLIFWREWMEIYGADYDYIMPFWIAICVCINLIFFVDLSFRFLYQGFWIPLKSVYALLEILFQILNFAALMKYLITMNYYFTLSVLEFIILVRLAKILQLLDEIKTWKIILKTLRHLVVPFMNLFLVQIGIVYFYAIVGERIYGGKINFDNLDKLSDAGLGKEYITMNFNDLISSMLTLLYFSLAWTNMFKLFIAIQPGIISMVFTFSFFIFSILCLWNIMIATAIEVYSAVSNYYDKFAKSRVQFVDEDLRKKMQKLKELEKTIGEYSQRAKTMDESSFNALPKLIPETEDSRERIDYLDSHFEDRVQGT